MYSDLSLKFPSYIVVTTGCILVLGHIFVLPPFPFILFYPKCNNTKIHIPLSQFSFYPTMSEKNHIFLPKRFGICFLSEPKLADKIKYPFFLLFSFILPTYLYSLPFSLFPMGGGTTKKYTPLLCSNLCMYKAVKFFNPLTDLPQILIG